MSQEPARAPADQRREVARAIARARLVLRVAIGTHKRSIAAHRDSMRELGAELDALEQTCERLGIDLVLEDQAEPPPRGRADNKQSPRRQSK